MQTGGRGMLRAAILAALLMILLFVQAWADTLGPSSTGEAVRQLQVDLKEKGYYTARTITSTYTSSLKKSVGVFQDANNIKPAVARGYADDETQRLAASDDAITYPQYQADRQLRPGGRGSYVKKAQTRLRELGYYSGKMNSYYSSIMTAAVKFFQTANGLSPTGLADIATRAVLYSTDVISRAKYDELNYITPLGIGAKGTQVTQLQEQLQKKGFYGFLPDDKPSGVYDAQTKYSVKFFQEANGLSATGIADRRLRALINKGTSVTFATYSQNMKALQLSSRSSAGVKIAVLQLRLQDLGYYNGVISGVYSSAVVSAVRLFQSFNYPTLTSISGKADTTTRTLMNGTGAKKYADICGSDTLKMGDTGDAVTDLQNRLKALGYYKGGVDGVYDSGVASAVKLFQKCTRYYASSANTLYPSGVAYTKTLTVLNGSSAKSYLDATIEAFIDVAESRLGKKYVSGGRGPYQFDCSGFTAYCLKQMGIRATSEVRAQGRSKIGRKITIEKPNSSNATTYYKVLKRGDLLYFWSPDRKKKPGHAAIYLGNNKFIHASSTEKKVTVSAFRTYNERSKGPWFLWAIRIWE